MTKFYPDLITRLEQNSKIDFITGCIEWQLSRDKDGYGRIQINKRPRRVHRIVAELFLPEYNKNLLVCHICDNPPCINPQHLYMGTASDNQKDSLNKGRNKNPWGVTPEEVIIDIFALREEGLTYKQIGNLFSLSHTSVRRILQRPRP